MTTEGYVPDTFEVVALNGDGLEHAPKPVNPYYLKAKEGDYLYRATQLGPVLLPERKPLPYGRVGYAQGVFTWEGPKVPGSIISQATDFFRRVLKTHHTEAEVLITKHNETGEFRLFVPHQRTNYSGVKSVFEPSHIDRNYSIVGTLHSHCDFSAFHSGTDSADASDMDGVHFTIGMLSRETPEIVAMVAMGGKEFHYEDPTTIADIEFTGTTAPPWWDNYVYPGDVKFDKPKGLKSITDDQWEEFRGFLRMAGKPKVTAVTKWSPPKTNEIGYRTHRTDWDWTTEFNDDFGMRGNYTPKPREITTYKPREIRTFDDILEIIDFAVDNGLMTEEEWEAIPPEAAFDETAMLTVFTTKMNAIFDINSSLRKLASKTKKDLLP